MRFTEFLINEVYDEQHIERNEPDKQGKIDRIINLLDSDPESSEKAEAALSQVGIDWTMDVPTMTHMLLKLDDGNTRDGYLKLDRLYSELKPYMDLDF